MEQRIAVLTDSCADIPAALQEQNGIQVLPVLVNCNGSEYRDGVDITTKELFSWMEKGAVPKTSMPSQSEVVELLDGLYRKGMTHAVFITMSSAISGTYQMISRVCSEYSHMVCKAVDSGMAAIAEGALVLQLAEEIRTGLQWEKVEERVRFLKQNTFPFFALDTLKYLMRGGRIGKVTAIAGEVLNIKPILSFDENGVIDSVEKVRGRKAAIHHLADRVIGLSDGHKRYKLYFSDSMAEEDRLTLEAQILKRCDQAIEVVRSQIGCALGVHLGPGLIGAGIQLLD